MAVVDSLEVEIQAKAKQASKEIDVLCGKLGNLSSQLSSIDSKGLQKFSSGLSVFSTGMKTLRDLKMPDFTRTVKGLKKFESIDGQKLAVVSNALNPLAGSLRTLGNTNFNNRSINGMVSSIARLTSSVQGGINTSGIDELGNAIAGMMNTLSSAGEVAPKTSSFVNALSRLANAGEKTSATASGLPKLSRELKTFMNSMKTAPTISKDTTELTNAIARLASAGTRTNQTAAGLENLAKKVKEFMASMQNAPQVSQNTLRMVTAMGNLASAGQSAGASLNSISARGNMTSGMLSRLGGGFKNVVSKMTGFGRESKNIASSIGMFYAKFFMVIRGIKALGGAIGSAQDYIEEFNYFSVAMDKVGRDSAKKFKEAGYNSAEEYANSFRTRFATLQKQMTGYDVNYDTGEALSSMTHNLGLDLTQVMNFQSAITQITNSAGMLGETSINTSKALSMLAADWSSLANLDLETTMQNMQSGITGNSRVLYKYGLDITKAGLAQTALAHGISANVTSMSQQEKMQLRVLTMLEQSKVAYGDLARTINQPANQLRMLEAGFKRLSMTIGSLFMPMIQKLYPYLNAIVIVLQEFAQWVAKLAGIKLGDYDNSTSFPDFEDAADGADDYADSTKKASKAQKKLSDNLQDFDIAKKLDSNKNNDGSGNSKKNGNGAGIDLSKDISDALANYEKVWNKAFKSNKNKAVKIASEIKKALLSGWKTGDFTKLGTAVGNWINKAISNIPWAKIQNTVKKLAKSIATFLNGAIMGTDWSLVGSTIGNSLNTVFGGLNTFFRDFNWLGLGQSLAEMFNSAVKTTDFSLIGQTLGNKLRGMIQFAYGAITTADFDGLGKKISDGINGFFKQMGEVRPNTGLTGWQELGQSISKTITGFATTINTALSGVRWVQVGRAIGQFLGSIDWGDILKSVGKMIATALFSAFKIGIGAMLEDPMGVLGAFATVIGGIFAYKKLKKAFDALKIALGFKKAIGDVVSDGAENVNLDGPFNKLSKKLGDKIKGLAKDNGIISSIGVAGKSLGAAIGLEIAAVAGTFLVSELEAKLNDLLGKNTSQLSLRERIKYATGSDEEKAYGQYVYEQEKINKKAMTYAEWQKQINKGKEKSKDKTGDKVIDAGNEFNDVLKNQQKSANDAANANKKLRNTWEKLGVSGSKAKKAASALDNAYKSGKLSLENYKKIANGSYTSTESLNSAISKIAGKKVSAEVNASVSGKNDVDNLSSSLNNIPATKESKTKVTVENANSLDDVANKYGNIPTVKNSTLSVTTKTSGLDSLSEKIKKAVNDIKLAPIPLKLTTPTGKAIDAVVKATSDKIAESFKGTSASGLPGNMKKTDVDITKKTAKVDKNNFLEINLLKRSGYKVQTYATGGFPEDGWFRANHGEVMGKFDNGKSVVANNEQITNGIANAVGPAVYSAVSQAMSENSNTSTPNVYLDKTKITKEVMSTAQQIARSRGSGWQLA